jgi:hypothetical protein
MNRRDLRSMESEWRATCRAPRPTSARKPQQAKKRTMLARIVRAFFFFL